MALSRKQSTLIHVARKELALADTDYRAILFRETGVETSRDLDQDGFDDVMRRFEALGFKPSARPPSFGHRYGMASPRQVACIRSLWNEYTSGEGDDRSLGKWLLRTFKVSDIRFVRYGTAGKVITALRAMVTKKHDTNRTPTAAAK